MTGRIFSSAFGDTAETVEAGVNAILNEKDLIMPLVNFKDSPAVLKKPARKVELFDDELQHFVLRMVMTMRNVTWGNCVGLAANQVGDDRALFIAEGLVYVNPEIIWMTGAPKDRSLEGCYSLEENKELLSIAHLQSH